MVQTARIGLCVLLSAFLILPINGSSVASPFLAMVAPWAMTASEDCAERPRTEEEIRHASKLISPETDVPNDQPFGGRVTPRRQFVPTERTDPPSCISLRRGAGIGLRC